MKERTELNTKIALETRDKILSEYLDILEKPNRKKYLPVLKGISSDTISITDFRVPGWYASDRLVELNDLFHKLKKAINIVQTRDYLSITPKVEDIKVVYKWIETFDVPHFYFQVFFDKVYGISFYEILELISDPDNDGDIFSVERDNKNQNKTTIKITSKVAEQVAAKVEEPNHESVRKEIGRGRLLFYVTFKGGTAYLDIDNLRTILGVKEEEL